MASVGWGHQPLIGDAVIDDGRGLMLIVQKFPNANTLEVTRGIEETVDDMRPGLPAMELDTTIFRPATFIEQAFGNLMTALLLGVLLVVLILAAFLFEWRTAFISLIAIPPSLLAAILVLQAFGTVINVMILAGLIVAIGVVVDDAIIDVENIVRRLRQNGARVPASRHRHRARSIGGGAHGDHLRDADQRHCGRAGLFPGGPLRCVLQAARALVRDCGARVDDSGADRHAGAVPDPVVERAQAPGIPPLRVLKRGYGAVSRASSAPRPAIVTVAVVMLAGVVVAPTLGTILLPSFKERTSSCTGWRSQAPRNRKSFDLGSGCKDLQEIPGVRNCGSHIGQAFNPTSPTAWTSARTGSASIPRSTMTRLWPPCRTWSMPTRGSTGMSRHT